MADAFADQSSGLNSPASKAAAVVPDDDNDLAAVSRGLWVGTGGHITLIAAGDTVAVEIKNVPSGSLLSIRTKRVMEATTAQDIVALS